MRNQPLALLGGITPAQFLAEYWQKKPLLIRQALPGFSGLLSPNELAGLSCEDDVQSRIIQHQKSKWSVSQGPFSEEVFNQLPKRDWTLLVQSVNNHLPAATKLLSQFNFIPHARLDDLMVSYAPDGGGIGAHVDSYDVFLLQGMGKRLWRISEQSDLSLVVGAPLKLLKNFVAEFEYELVPGDMLYLPPQVAHWGLAVDGDCMTYSIGFRAPNTQEIMEGFLGFMQDKVAQKPFLENSFYQDADLALQVHASEISQQMVKKVSDILNQLRWGEVEVAEFLGSYLTEPKSDIVFTHNSGRRRKKTMTQLEFLNKLRAQPIYLSLKSRMLCYQHQYFINGELMCVPELLLTWIQKLADERQLSVTENSVDDLIDEALLGELSELLHPHFLAGYFVFEHLVD